ncbi:synaptic vesicular amine transporter-like isoform X2 [Limulus polyphemus]|uniref:Synaptic vesicular amine transporter-like isoform X2 n=1 Tax=Limulus polyphemus TaxID=6850 RepID=A0ABM1T773_LIMPO|nr:synaptic vesicular amine transporter-like isoform X2 [Limulus polyphemus]
MFLSLFIMREEQSIVWRIQHSGRIIVSLVYFSLFLDNVLLTVVVPIIPDYLYKLEHGKSNQTEKDSLRYDLDNDTATTVNNSRIFVGIVAYIENRSSEGITQLDLPEQIGLFFATKAFVQLVANTLVGQFTNRVGYTIPLLVGSLTLLISSLLFALERNVALLFVARGVQGIGSACTAIGGMALVADRYPDDKDRSKVMGIAMGGIATGVLVGYPFGGVMYNFVGKASPFLILAGLIFLNVVLQFIILQPRVAPETMLQPSPLKLLVADPYILIACGAVWVSTSAMAVLEPCLPVWLMDTMELPRWQLGTVFVPDSVGYLLGTNLFGSVAFRIGRWLAALVSLLVVGVCALGVPLATRMVHLIVPHFGLGLGIGITDAALMPLLAHVVDTRHVAMYGTVYSIVQVAVSLAYSIAPLVGGVLVQWVGFPWLIRSLGILNIIYSPLCFLLRKAESKEEDKPIVMDSSLEESYQSIGKLISYSRFFNEDVEG